MNWEKLVNDILNSGITQDELSAETGISQSFISELKLGKKGSRLSYDYGQKLVSVFERISTKTKPEHSHG